MSFQLRTLTLNGGAPSYVYEYDAYVANLLVRNAFLVFRMAFLALFIIFAFLTLIFASWNVHATHSLGLKATSTSILIIFESCLSFFCIMLAFVDFYRPKIKASRPMYECVWTGVLGILQMGGATGLAINGPALVCQATGDLDVCASASSLIPTQWLKAFLVLAYFFVLFITVMAHKPFYPEIWKLSLHSVQWFDGSIEEQPPREMKEKKAKSSKPVKIAMAPRYEEEDPYADWYGDVESNADRKKMYPIRNSVEENIPWGPHWPLPEIRRGIDHPFATQPSSSRSSPATGLNNISLPSLPPPSAKSGSRYIERFRDSLQFFSGNKGDHDGPARPPPDVPPKPFAKHYHAHKTSFPESVVDDDHPIPLPHLSEWIRADMSLNDQSRYPTTSSK